MIGDNSKHALTEDQRAALIFHHVRKMRAIKARIDEINAEKKELKADIKNDGLDPKDIDFTMKALIEGDAATDKFRRQGELLTMLGLAPGFQADPFKDRAPILERAFASGKVAGLAALERVSPYGPGSDEDQEWLRGYDAGQKVMQENLQAAMEAANAAKQGLEDEVPEE